MPLDPVKSRKTTLWQSMKKRCKVGGIQQRNNPTYIGCCMSYDFQNKDYFKQWCESAVGFWEKDDEGNFFQLDKDLLVKGNKEYGQDTCVFIPREVNMFLSKSRAARGSCPIGVSYNKAGNYYVSMMYNKGKQYYLGKFNDSINAWLRYKEEKEKLAKALAEKWKNKIDIRAYLALKNYEVAITD